MDTLNTYALLDIFKFLKLPALRACRLVCREWNKVLSNSNTFHSENIYIIANSFASTLHLLLSKTNWPGIRFAGCLTMSCLTSFLPSTTWQNLSSLQVHECVFNTNCLHQMLTIPTLIDFRIIRCFLIQSYPIITFPLLSNLNIQKLALHMVDQGIAFVAQNVLPYLNNLDSLAVKEVSQRSILKSLFQHTHRDKGRNCNPFFFKTINLADKSCGDSKYIEEIRNWPHHIQASLRNSVTDDTNLDPAMSHFIEAIARNSTTLRVLKFSFLKCFHPWNEELFTKLIPALIENKLQLTNLALNTSNIPLRYLHHHDASPASQAMRNGMKIAGNLKTFFASQNGLTKLTLGMKQLYPAVQLEIIDGIPQTVEDLKVWLVNPPIADSITRRLTNLKRIRIPEDSAERTEKTTRYFGYTVFGSLVHSFLGKTGDLTKLRAFKGEFLFSCDSKLNFTTATHELRELDLKSAFIENENLQLIIQHFPKLRSLVLREVKVDDVGITGFSKEFIAHVEEMENYPKILETMPIVRHGYSISDLKYLKRLKICGKISLSDFGVYYGLKGLELIRLELKDPSETDIRVELSNWGLNLLASQSKQTEIIELCLGRDSTYDEETLNNFVTSLCSLDYRHSKITTVRRPECAFRA